MKKIILALIISAGCVQLGFAAKKVNIAKPDAQRFINAIANIQHYYISSVKTSKLIDYAIKGMLTNLDPHSAYLDASAIKSLTEVTSGEFDGIGVTVSPKAGVLKVISPLDGTPAQKAGIKAGDLIVRINNKLVRNMTLDNAVNMMRGRKGSKVNLYVIRNTKLLKFVVKRTAIKVPVVSNKLYDHHYGYLRIALFNKPTTKEVQKAINKLQNQADNKLYGVIIDLRNNPGGMLIPAIKTTDLFLDAKKLKKNKLIVYIKGNNTKRQTFDATRGELLPNLPVVVLVNAGTASAAEIMAGALQDHGRAVIVGTKSFGKGSVQKIFMLDKKHAMKLTIALYYTPNGRAIQAQGIQPNVMIPSITIPKSKNSNLFDPLYEANLQNYIRNGDSKKQQNAENRLLHQDFQLYEALNVLKGLATQEAN